VAKSPAIQRWALLGHHGREFAMQGKCLSAFFCAAVVVKREAHFCRYRHVYWHGFSNCAYDAIQHIRVFEQHGTAAVAIAQFCRATEI
jgi:hypothetical protein